MDLTAHSVLAEIKSLQPEMTQWRRDIHQHPELGFEEKRTAKIVADLLQAWGYTVHQGIGKTGVVGELRTGYSERSIGLRADLDALPMNELNEFEHRSINPGVFHGCGHDGHTAMLLGAAKYLADKRNFDGTLYVIFQPAEEGLGGAAAMIDEGLFTRFPMDQVFGMHNWPGVPVGTFAILPGPMMAAYSRFTIRITGVGGHAAFPHLCTDPIIIAAQVINSLQTIVSRNVNPIQTAVVSVTQVHAGDAYNVIPQEASLCGGVRYFDKDVGALIKQRMSEMLEHIAASYNAQIDLDYDDTFVALVNDKSATQTAVDTVKELVGNDGINQQMDPLMGSEDFAFMLQKRPGAYILVGNGDGKGGCMVHHPEYDFNDDAGVFGAAYWCLLVIRNLPGSPA